MIFVCLEANGMARWLLEICGYLFLLLAALVVEGEDGGTLFVAKH